jgi:hypothetical protein
MILGADTLVPVTDDLVAQVRARFGAAPRFWGRWEATFNTPAVALPCPVMLWQFAIDCIIPDGIDFDMLNPDPAIASALLNRLAFPPAA